MQVGTVLSFMWFLSLTRCNNTKISLGTVDRYPEPKINNGSCFGQILRILRQLLMCIHTRTHVQYCALPYNHILISWDYTDRYVTYFRIISQLLVRLLISWRSSNWMKQVEMCILLEKSVHIFWRFAIVNVVVLYLFGTWTKNKVNVSSEFMLARYPRYIY